MSFLAFQLYLFSTFLRPVELFAQWLVPYRPMLVLWLLAFGLACLQVMREKEIAAQKAYYGLLSGLTVAIGLSVLSPRGLGVAVASVSEFSASGLLFVLISFNLTTIRRLKYACYAILLSMGILCSAGINAYYTGYMAQDLVLRQQKDDDSLTSLDVTEAPAVPAQDRSGAYMWRVRAVGFLNDPNDFAQAIVMTMPMLWWFYRKGRWLRNGLTVMLPAAVMGYTVFLTNSRGAMLGVAALMFFGIRSLLGTTRTAILLGIAGAVAALGNMTGGRGFSTHEESASGRIDAWYEGFLMLKSSPLLGVGFGEFTEHNYLTAHNSFVLCFAELGLLGYFFWVGLLVLSYKSVSAVVQHAPADSDELTAGLILRSSFIGYMTCAWFLSRTYQPILYALMALCASAWFCTQKAAPGGLTGRALNPVKWGRATWWTMFLSMSAVYMFIMMRNMKG